MGACSGNVSRCAPRVSRSQLTNYGRVSFFSLTDNGAGPALNTGESIALVQNGQVVSNPSAPNASGDAFDVCFGSGACP